MKMENNEELVNEIVEDFKTRQMNRKKFEQNWILNINFYIGNQYCAIDRYGDIQDYDKQYFWQEREVFNHIAPLMELRMCKLNRVRPVMGVNPFSNDENDIYQAKICKKILQAVQNEKNMSKLISNATLWSELCGTSFYKITWDSSAGYHLKDENSELSVGDVNISVVSPFEIFPDSNSYESITDCRSIIHAHAYHIQDIKNKWGVEVEGQEINVFTLDNVTNVGGLGYTAGCKKATTTTLSEHALVLEKYEKPSVEYPNGRLIIVAGDKLLYVGELPYQNGENGERIFPFIRQVSNISPNCFWGMSIIERCIPVQRAYNTIKNRKHEYINRLSMGVLTVEDGSVDTDNLEEEGMSPGKVLVYRQGSTPPKMLNGDSVPTDFTYEEDRLLNELLEVSGVSDLVKSSSAYSNMSGTALQLLIEQDESRLVCSAEEIRNAVREISRQVLRLYKEFATVMHTSRLVGDTGSIEAFYWDNSDISSDDVVFETENELNETQAQRRSMLFELFNAGLFADETGVLNNSMRAKLLQSLGYGTFEYEFGANSMQSRRADKENEMLVLKKDIKVREIDDHKVHIDKHTAYMLSAEFDKYEGTPLEEKMLNHIREHKQYMALTNEMANLKN